MTEQSPDDDITARLRAALDELTAATAPSHNHVAHSARPQRRPLMVVTAAVLVAVVAAGAIAWGQRDTKHSISSPPSSASPEVDVGSTTTGATTDAPVVPVSGGAGTASTTTVPAVSAAQQYEALTTVLQNADHGPELCLSGVLQSSPPICGDVPVTNWDWTAVPEAQTIGEVTWVDSVVVTGTYDGNSFTLTTSPHPPSAEDTARFTRAATSFAAPCPPPANGWAAEAAKVPDGSDAMAAVTAYVNSQPDYSGGWVDQSINHTTDPAKMNDPQKLILVERFTGGLAAHEAALRAIWPGALCVTLGKYTTGEAQAIQDRISELLSSPDLPPHSFFGASVNIDATITATVVVATPQLQQLFDATFGAGIVTQEPILRAIDTPPSG